MRRHQTGSATANGYGLISPYAIPDTGLPRIRPMAYGGLSAAPGSPGHANGLPPYPLSRRRRR